MIGNPTLMDDKSWMRRCFDLAMRGRGHASPNPLVGAILVHGNRIIGEGFHAGFGKAHAEVMAFESVASELRHLIPESTLYVNLEPCHHYGKTPPCSLRIEKEGVQTIKIGAQDPNPLVAGQGIAHLRSLGKSVTVGILEKEALWLNRFFYTYFEKKRPYIILKWAQTADGYIGEENKRTIVSGQLAQIASHSWRKEVDAIIIGRGTAVIDNPELTDRWHGGPDPIRIVIDPSGSIPRQTRIMADEHPSWILSRVEKPDSTPDNKRWILLEENESAIDRILQETYSAGMSSIFVEGGRETLLRWINSGYWDEARVIQSPKLLRNGIKAPVVKGELMDQFNAGADRISIIKKS